MKEVNEDNVREIIKSNMLGDDYGDLYLYEDDIGKTASDISKLRCPKCKNIRYMDKKELEEVLEKYTDEESNLVYWDEAIPAILKLAIPEDKKIKGTYIMNSGKQMGKYTAVVNRLKKDCKEVKVVDVSYEKKIKELERKLKAIRTDKDMNEAQYKYLKDKKIKELQDEIERLKKKTDYWYGRFSELNKNDKSLSEEVF